MFPSRLHRHEMLQRRKKMKRRRQSRKRRRSRKRRWQGDGYIGRQQASFSSVETLVVPICSRVLWHTDFVV